MSKINYLATEAIEDFKLNFQTYKHYFLNEKNDDLLELCLQNNWLHETNIDYPRITLNMNDDYSISDRANVEILYEGMKNLPHSYATDERFWLGLIISTDFWDYVIYRRRAELQTKKDEEVKNSFLFTRGIKRSNYINCVSRLWWAGKLCYDPDSIDHYRTADLICESAFASNMILLSSSNVTANNHVFLGIIDCLLDRQKKGEKIGRYHYVNALRYLNSIGSTFLIDTLSRQEVSHIVDTGLRKLGTKQTKTID